jgi:hypothetical protein
MNMIKKLKALMLLTALVAGLTVSFVGVLPVSAALVPSSRAWKSTDGGANFFDIGFNYSNFRGIAQEVSSKNKIDQLAVFSAGKNVPEKSENFQYDDKIQYDDKSSNWYVNAAKGSIKSNSGLNLGASSYFWYQHMPSKYHYDETDPGKQLPLDFDDGIQIGTKGILPVPIPGAALLLASGLLGLCWLNQRRSKGLRG